MDKKINKYLKNNLEILTIDKNINEKLNFINVKLNMLIKKIKIETKYNIFQEKKKINIKNIIIENKRKNNNLKNKTTFDDKYKKIDKNITDNFDNKNIEDSIKHKGNIKKLPSSKNLQIKKNEKINSKIPINNINKRNFNKNKTEKFNLIKNKEKIKDIKNWKTLSLSEINNEDNTFIDNDLEDNIWKSLNFEGNPNSLKTIKFNEEFKFSDTSKLRLLENLNNISYNMNFNENKNIFEIYKKNNKFIFYDIYKCLNFNKDLISRKKFIFFIINLKIKRIIKIINEIDIENINICQNYNFDNIINFYLKNLQTFIDWNFLKKCEEFKISAIDESYVKSINNDSIDNFLGKIDTLPNDIIVFYKVFFILLFNFDLNLIFKKNINEILKEKIFKSVSDFEGFLKNIKNIIYNIKFENALVCEKILNLNNFIYKYKILNNFDEFTANLSILLKNIIYYLGISNNNMDNKKLNKNYFKRYLYNQIKKHYLNNKLEEINRIMIKYN